MSRDIEPRLRAALAAKASSIAETHVQPPEIPQDGSLLHHSHRFRQVLMVSAPIIAAAAVAGLAIAGTLTLTAHRAAPSAQAIATPPAPPRETGPAPHPVTTPPPGSPASDPTTQSSRAATSPALPAGGPVPTGFQPASVTFVSSTFGYVLGQPPSCASPPCTSLVRTTDRGVHWTGVPAPRASLGDLRTLTAAGPSTSISTVRFADQYNGWAYGPALWVTHDGARSWHPLNVGGQVLALESGGGRVEAVVTRCPGDGKCPVRSPMLLSSPVDRDEFSLVMVLPTDVSAPGGWYGGASITLHPPAGFALLGATTKTSPPTGLIVATADNRTWQTFPDPCRAVSHGSLSSFVAPDTTSLVSVCSAPSEPGNRVKTIVITRDGKSTALGTPPAAGDSSLIAANGISTILLATMGINDHLYRSTDSGRTWVTLPLESGNEGISDLGFTTSSQAVLIHGQPSRARKSNPPAELLITADAGATWQRVSF